MFGNSASAAVAEANAAAVASSENRFSVIELRRIHTQLVENKVVNDENKSLVVEILRIIAEMVVYGDNKSELLFDFFCEKNMLSLFLQIMGGSEGGCPAAVHIQILQTLSILINCVRNDTSLYYLLSNNYINEIITFPFALAADENLCDQFASFMKSLSLKLNIQTVQFFFIEETGAFPILTRAIGLLDAAAEPMVRISSQATILNVYRVEDSRAREYALQEEVMQSLFVKIVALMKSQHSSITAVCLAYYQVEAGFAAASPANAEEALRQQNKLENQLEDVLASTEDWFYYLQDILDLRILVLRQALVHHLLCEFVYPVLLAPILQYHRDYGVGDEGESQSAAAPSYEGIKSSTENVMRSLEIEFADPNKGRSSGSAGSGSSQSRSVLESLARTAERDQQAHLITMNAALVYLLQMLRFITDPMLQRAMLVVLYHPLSQSARSSIIEDCIAAAALTSATVTTASSPIVNSPAPSNADSVASVKLDSDPVAVSDVVLEEAGNSVSAGAAADSGSAVVLVDTVPAQSSAKVAAVKYEKNVFAESLSRVLRGEDQRLALTSLFLFHVLAVGLVAGNPSKTVEGESYLAADVLTSLQMVRVLQCMNVLPCVPLTAEDLAGEGGEESVQDAQALAAVPADSAESTTRGTKNDRHRSQRGAHNAKKALSSASSHAYDRDPDLLSLSMFLEISNRALARGAEAARRPLLSVQMDVLKYAASHSLTAVQVAAHSVYVVANLFYDAFDSAAKSGARRNDGASLLGWILGELRTAVKYAALSLSARTDGPQAEVLLNLVREEMRRYEGRKWKTVTFRMYGDILMFLPATAGNKRRMGIDFEIPISQAEAMRKDIQVFLVLRTLFRHVAELARFTKDIPVTADLCASIKDQDFLGLYESSIIPSTIVEGNSYDMRGKRFLDSVLVHSGLNQPSGSASGSASSQQGGSIWATSASILTLGYLGGGNRRSLPASSGGALPGTPPSKSGKQKSEGSKGAAPTQNILFIQEPAVLLLISQDKTHSKIGFKVFAAIPLLYVDAKVDPEDKRRFKVIVRSWRPLPQMCRVESEGVSAAAAEDDSATGSAAPGLAAMHKTRRGAQSEGYRKASERSTFWTVTLAMETEQACMLAVQHIESRRQEISAQKLLRLKTILNTWASESAVNTNDDI